jgi:hypothetical protein
MVLGYFVVAGLDARSDRIVRSYRAKKPTSVSKDQLVTDLQAFENIWRAAISEVNTDRGVTRGGDVQFRHLMSLLSKSCDRH